MACDRVPAADDLIPVLIYVVIMVNVVHNSVHHKNALIQFFLGKSTLFIVNN